MLPCFDLIIKSTPKPLKPLKPSTLIPIFFRVFPHKIKFLSHAHLSFASNSPTRKFSTSGRPGPGLDTGEEVRAVRTFGDDEASLRDWIDGLTKNGSKKTQLCSDIDKEIDDGKKDDGRERREGTALQKFKRSNRHEEAGFGDRFKVRDGNVSREDGRGRNERVSEGARGTGRFGDRFSVSREDGWGRNERVSEGSRWTEMFGDGSSAALSDENKTVKQNEFKGFEIFKELMGSDVEENEESDEEENDESESEDDVNLINRETVMSWRQKQDHERTSPPTSTSSDGSYLSQTRFDQVSVSPATMKALKDIGYEKLTVVQEATLPVILKGKDVMAKARTGTGKTVAFLLPSIDVIEKAPPAIPNQMMPPILVLILCPTRELACQAAAEADKLLKYHPSLGVQVVIGGTRLALEQKRMHANPCQMLVATPGRLNDHIENTSGFRIRLSGVKVLVLDEADYLLDMGFRKDIENTVAAVPKKRQTLLFSATIPTEVKQICHIALRRDYEYINTVQEGSEETHTQVLQTHLITKLGDHFPLLYTLLKEHIADNIDYKVLVFCTTAMVTRLIAELLAELKLNVREIHSRKSQSYRTKVSNEFRKSKGLILVTSDVSARGVDYPDVTLVVQLGMPADRQQYIHRLGRTGRKGKEGRGVLLLAPFEEFFLSAIKDLPITKAPISVVGPESKKMVQRAMSHVERQDKEAAYQAWLGYYNSSRIGKDKIRLVKLANEFSSTMGLDKPPPVHHKVLCKMGLKNIPGLRSTF